MFRTPHTGSKSQFESGTGYHSPKLVDRENREEELILEIDIKGIQQIAVPVADIERATGFYKDILGLNHLFSVPNGLAFFQVGEVRLLLSAFQKPDAAKMALVYLQVSDIKARHAELVAGGTAIIEAPHVVSEDGGMKVWINIFKDTEGNELALYEEVSNS